MKAELPPPPPAHDPEEDEEEGAPHIHLFNSLIHTVSLIHTLIYLTGFNEAQELVCVCVCTLCFDVVKETEFA